jgi:hypothetical protein
MQVHGRTYSVPAVALLDGLPLGRHIWPDVKKNDNVVFFRDVKSVLFGRCSKMGALVADGYVPHVQDQLNSRFTPGEALKEMIGFQKEFKLFSPDHSLRSSFTLLNIAPVEEKDREGFLTYLDRLTKVASQVNGQPSTKTGHDQIVASLQENLESTRPLPVYFTYHPSGSKPRTVFVTFDTPLSFSATEYLTISVPTIPKVPTKGKKPSSRKS